MNERQFLLIRGPQHETDANPAGNFVNSLMIPDGYTVDQVMLQGQFSLAQGYNVAMRNSTARYKIYLSQKTAILNPHFLADILALFQTHPRLGMLGVVGAKTLPANGNWREAPDRCGKIVYLGKIIDYHYEITNDYEPVLGVDGMIMITQYDLTWREDLFADFFVDAAQCLEFVKAGYSVGIPRQREPWCSYNDPSDSLFEYYREREVFVSEYQAFFNTQFPG
jgi:hypothetical protein